MSSKSNFTIQTLTPILLFLTAIILLFHLIHPAISMTQDLGRHLKLGEIILSTKQVPQTNLFTYTNQNFEFINHHWLSEVIFYLIYSHFGINPLIILKIILLFFAFALIIYLSAKQSSLPLTASISVIFLPIFLERTHIRPEIFSMLLFSLIFLILNKIKDHIPHYFLLIIPLLFFLWVNLHIYFAAGLCLLTFYIINQILHKKAAESHYLLLIISYSLCLINPNGFKGLFLPLNIFKTYGYSIIENQNPFFLLQAAPSPSIWPFFISLPLAAFAIYKSFKLKNYFHFLTALFFTALALKQIRNFPLYALALLPLTSFYLSRILNTRYKILNTILPLALIIQIYSLSKTPLPQLNEPQYIHQAFNFIKKHDLKAPFFNNFDISGLAIYYLYPPHQLFVDNRPEAFPAEFFENIFIPAMQNPQIFDQINQIYNFNTIIFSHTDITPWATAFISAITQNQNWTIVYLDNRHLILVNNHTQSNLASEFEINDQNAIAKLQPWLTANDPANLYRLNRFFSLASWNQSHQYTTQRLNFLLK